MLLHKTNGHHRYKYHPMVGTKYYLKQKILKYSTISNKKFSKTDIIKMLDIFNDIIFVTFGGCIFQQTICIPMGNKMCSSFRRLVALFVWGTCTSNIGFKEIWIEGSIITLASHSVYRWCHHPELFTLLRTELIALFHWTWIRWHYKYS